MIARGPSPGSFKEVPKSTPFRSGFLLTTRELGSVAHFHRMHLPGGWKIWVDSSVATNSAEDSLGNFVLLRGHWADLSGVETDSSPAEKLVQALETGWAAFHELLSYMAGRFVIFASKAGSQRIYHDAMGTRSVYYSETGELVASHLHLLTQLDAPEARPEMRMRISRATDEAPYCGIFHLLPNFFLDLGLFSPVRFFPHNVNQFSGWGRADKLAFIVELWGRMLDAYSHSGWKLAMSVTGGLDSRFLIAMSQSWWRAITFFTYGQRDSGSSDWAVSVRKDMLIAERIADKYGLKPHLRIDVAEELNFQAEDLLSAAKQNSWHQHGHCLLPHYRRAFGEEKWLHLRGTGVEAVRGYWVKPDGNDDFESVTSLFGQTESSRVAGRAEVLGYRDDTFGYHRMDLAYWEFRMGKWHAELLNESDVVFDTLVPIGVRALLDVLLSFSPSERSEGFHIMDLIDRSVPEMNFMGINDERNLYQITRDDRLRKVEESRSPIGPVRVTNGQGAAEARERSRRRLRLEAGEFRRGWQVKAEILRAPVAGTLQFRVGQRAVHSSRSHFQWLILVDGEVHLVVPGGGEAVPVQVRVQGLRRESLVEIAVVALEDHPDRIAWSRVSEVWVLDPQMWEQETVGAVTVTSDWRP